MSSAVCSTSAAQSRPFVFEMDEVGEIRPQSSGTKSINQGHPPRRVLPEDFDFKDAKFAGVTPASRLAIRPAPEMVSSGIAAVDALTGGLPRGCLTEICGPPSSGRTTVLLSALAAATQRGECCALVDAGDALDPQSVVNAGIELDRLLWVRCGENSRRGNSIGRKISSDAEKKNFLKTDSQDSVHCLDQLLRATDLLLESGGFGLIVLDLGDLPPQIARRIPLTTWFRFRRAVEHTPTVLLAMERHSIAGSCSSLLLKLGQASAAGMSRRFIAESSEAAIAALQPAAHFPKSTLTQLLTEVEITVEMVKSRIERKPVQSAEITFASQTAWAG